jgi:hypothetical protein
MYKTVNNHGSRYWSGKRAAVISAVLLTIILAAAFLYARFFTLKPEFNVFEVSVYGAEVKFFIQNIGKADAHNVKTLVNGTWIQKFRVNLTFVENKGNWTLLRGDNSGWPYHVSMLGLRVLPVIADWKVIFTSTANYLNLTARADSDTLRHLTDLEVEILIDAFENPRPFYTYNESTIDLLRVGEVRTVTIILDENSDSYEVLISCDERITATLSLAVPPQ